MLSEFPLLLMSWRERKCIRGKDEVLLWLPLEMLRMSPLNRLQRLSWSLLRRPPGLPYVICPFVLAEALLCTLCPGL